MLSGLQILWKLFSSDRKVVVYTKRNHCFDTRVYRLETSRYGSLAVKVVKLIDIQASDLLKREHKYLTILDHKNIVTCRGYAQLPGYYFLATQWIDGYCLEGNLARLKQELSGPGDLAHFADMCRDILVTLQQADIVHRDIRPKNIIVRERQPVLIDFGWAIWKNETSAFIPENLKNPDDMVAMNNLLEQLTQ